MPYLYLTTDTGTESRQTDVLTVGGSTQTSLHLQNNGMWYSKEETRQLAYHVETWFSQSPLIPEWAVNQIPPEELQRNKDWIGVVYFSTPVEV